MSAIYRREVGAYFHSMIGYVYMAVLLFFNGFTASWNDYMGPQMYLTAERYPLATALFGSVYFLRNKPEVTLEPVTMAACVLFTIPVVVVFFLLQKYLVQGIVTTGIKG